MRGLVTRLLDNVGAVSRRSAQQARARTPDGERRFAFGRNWKSFLTHHADSVTLDRAERSLSEMLGIENIRGRTFCDVGCGSGLFSLAAASLGSSRVVSFDRDAESVECALTLRGSRPDWSVHQGSILDREFIRSLGTFDVVYAWGVLHHTGAMWEALDITAGLVADGGLLFVALYNDAGLETRAWHAIKWLYNRGPRVAQWISLAISFALIWLPKIMRDAVRGAPLKTWHDYGSERGMSAWTDLVDWVGGWPFEAARWRTVVEFARERGFTLARPVVLRRSGCNEFVFARNGQASSALQSGVDLAH